MSNYFEKLPDFEYVSRLPGAQISDYIKVKNLFKKGVLREDITAEMMFFTNYSIKNNDRPDNVANDFYGDSDLDWLVLTCNNIVNIQDQWPKSQTNWFSYLIDKYDNESNLYSGIHHYETTEVLNQENVVIIPAGLEVESDYTVDYFDNYLKTIITLSPVIAVTNFQFEEKIEDDRREIYLLKPRYLMAVDDDMDEMMTYQKGSAQYLNETLKRADNIRLHGY